MKNSLEITYLKISSLKPFGQNPRAHSKRQIAQLASSIKTFGFNCPILVDRDLNLIAGEARAAAARECGFDCVPAIVLPDMSDARKRAFRLAHNKLALNASWDPEVLKIELEYLLDAETEFDF